MIASINETKKKRSVKRKRSRRQLRFTPYAWAKLLYLRDIGPTEVGGFGISAADDLLLVDDIELVAQTCTAVSVEFDDDAVADFFDRQVDFGRQPEQFARIWIHTHPGASAAPSGTDEETFDRCFGGVDWAIMFILADEGNTYTRARFNVGPGTDRRLRCRTDFDCLFPAADPDAWFDEYVENVDVYDPLGSHAGELPSEGEFDWWERTPSAAQRWSDRLLETA